MSQDKKDGKDKKNFYTGNGMLEYQAINWETAEFLDAKDICRFKGVNKNINRLILAFLSTHKPIPIGLNTIIHDHQFKLARSKVNDGYLSLTADFPSIAELKEKKPNLSICYRAKFFGNGFTFLLFFSTLLALGGFFIAKGKEPESSTDKDICYGVGAFLLVFGVIGDGYVLNRARKSWDACTSISQLLARHSLHAIDNKSQLTQPLLQDHTAEEEYDEEKATLPIKK